MTAISNVLTGFRLFAGEKLNEIIAQVNNLTGNGTAGPVSGTTGAFSGAVSAASFSSTGNAFTQTPTVLAAAGATQGNAAAITKAFIIVTVSASTEGVKLPTASTGLTVKVACPGTKGVKVYPFAGDKISTAATNTAVALVADKTNIYWAKDATTWTVLKGA